MNIISKDNWFTLLTTFLLIISLIYIAVSHYQHPIKYTICNTAYEDCFVSAKFDDMRSCEVAKKMGSWLCDSLTDPENIQCKPSHNSLVASSYCSK